MPNVVPRRLVRRVAVIHLLHNMNNSNDQVSPNQQAGDTQSRDKFKELFADGLHKCLNMLHSVGILQAEFLVHNLKNEGSSHIAEAERLTANLREVFAALRSLQEMTRHQDKPSSDDLKGDGVDKG